MRRKQQNSWCWWKRGHVSQNDLWNCQNQAPAGWRQDLTFSRGSPVHGSAACRSICIWERRPELENPPAALSSAPSWEQSHADNLGQKLPHSLWVITNQEVRSQTGSCIHAHGNKPVLMFSSGGTWFLLRGLTAAFAQASEEATRSPAPSPRLSPTPDHVRPDLPLPQVV